MKFHHLPLLLLPLTALADGERQTYGCDNGSRIELSFSAATDGRPQATLHFADEAIVLPQVPAATGALYRNDALRLHVQGDAALFEDGKGNARRCRLGETAPATASPPPAASSFIDIAGSVDYRIRSALPPAAVLIVRVQNLARAGTPARTLAEQRIELAGQQVPIHFQTTIDRDLIGKKGRVTVTAHIEHRGKLLFVGDKAYPALHNGQPLPVDISLQPVGRQ